jgi:hypothetical protein
MTGDPFPARCRGCRVGIVDWPDADPVPEFCDDACGRRYAERRIARRLLVLALLERARIVRDRIRVRLRRRR